MSGQRLNIKIADYTVAGELTNNTPTSQEHAGAPQSLTVLNAGVMRPETETYCTRPDVQLSVMPLFWCRTAKSLVNISHNVISNLALWLALAQSDKNRWVCVCYLMWATGEGVCVVVCFLYSSCQIELDSFDFHNTHILSFILHRHTDRLGLHEETKNWFSATVLW